MMKIGGVFSFLVLILLCPQSAISGELPKATQKMLKEFNLDPSVCALSGGEDYELLFTVNQSDFEKINTMTEVKVIGHITEKSLGAKTVYPQGEEIEIKAQGWKSF